MHFQDIFINKFYSVLFQLMVVGQNGVIMEAAAELVGVEVSLVQEVAQTLHQRTTERNA